MTATNWSALPYSARDQQDLLRSAMNRLKSGMGVLTDDGTIFVVVTDPYSDTPIEVSLALVPR